jgi:hypothetical protein
MSFPAIEGREVGETRIGLVNASGIAVGLWRRVSPETSASPNESDETSEQIRLGRLQRFQRDENEFQDQADHNRFPLEFWQSQRASGS